MNETKIKKTLTKLYDTIINIKTFQKKDVDILLSTPFKEQLEYLLSLVNLTENEQKSIDLCFLKGKTIAEASDSFSVLERQVAVYLEAAKIKMYEVWSKDKNAHILLCYSKIYLAEKSIKLIKNILK